MQMSSEECNNFFFSMNGSKFVMARKAFDQYYLYLAHNISEETEALWREELLCKYYDDIQRNEINAESWIVFNSMYDLTIVIRNISALNIMEAALDLCNMEKARYFASESLNLAAIHSEEEELMERADRAKELCNKIICKLGMGRQTCRS